MRNDKKSILNGSAEMHKGDDRRTLFDDLAHPKPLQTCIEEALRTHTTLVTRQDGEVNADKTFNHSPQATGSSFAVNNLTV